MVTKKFNQKYKEAVRTYIRPLVNNKMVIFSLPYLNFMIERKAKRAVCCEKDKPTFETQQQIAPLNCALHNSMASEIIGQEPFDFIYLDLCGTLSKEFFLCLERAQLKPSGTIVITLLKAREHPYYTHLLKGNRIKGYYNILKKYGLYLYQTIEYKATSPMIVLFAKKTYSKKVKQLKIE